MQQKDYPLRKRSRQHCKRQYKIANFKTSPFAQSLRQAKILILEILNVFLRLKFLPFLTLDKIEHFETVSKRQT